ncbi:MAG: SDR family NAD(P)-dependent oxidoreductase [Nannocystis sp.]|nr:SDR family NAD(P)-dependent oxidoreductase [Nannocystis sp.]MBA3550049.1 SDR family NAD(P)-dependent oxidoreductase [Nannocystis sp.]
MSLPDRPRAVVTGAGGGLGRALCLELARRRGRVLAADIDLAAAELTAAAVRDAGGQAVAVACDVAQLTQVERLVEEAGAAFGGADLIVNNAGVAVSGPMADIPIADWKWIVGINLMGVVHGCRAFIPHFKARGGGAILNVASAAGLVCAPEMGPYNVTKAGVVALSETLCPELKPAKISVTVLCPTFFQTNIMQATRTQKPDQVHLVEKLMARAKLQAPEVARHALASVDVGELFSLPHADGSWMWRLKRLAPERFYQTLIPRYLRKMTGRKG